MALPIKTLIQRQFLGVCCFKAAGFWGLVVAIAIPAMPEMSLAQVRFQSPNVGAPGNREAGAARSGSCVTSDRGLVSLIPASNIGLTTAGYPRFLAYIPPTTARTGEFTLFDSGTDQEIYRTAFSIAGKAGIVQVPLPANAGIAPLEIGKTYYWLMTVVCDPQDRSADLVVQSSVQRVSSPVDLRGQFSSSQPAQVALFAQAGLWQDAVSSLATLLLREPNNPSLRAAWSELLNSVGLQEITDQPLL